MSLPAPVGFTAKMTGTSCRASRLAMLPMTLCGCIPLVR